MVSDPQNNTIYNSYVTEALDANPLMSGENSALVTSVINITLTGIQNRDVSIASLPNLRSAGSLIYSTGSQKRMSLDFSKKSPSNSFGGNKQNINNQQQQNEHDNHPNSLRKNQNAPSRQRR